MMKGKCHNFTIVINVGALPYGLVPSHNIGIEMYCASDLFHSNLSK